jgi:hypothetical protein
MFYTAENLEVIGLLLLDKYIFNLSDVSLWGTSGRF